MKTKDYSVISRKSTTSKFTVLYMDSVLVEYRGKVMGEMKQVIKNRKAQ